GELQPDVRKQHRNQQEDGEQGDGGGDPAQAMVIETRRHPEQAQTQEAPEALALEEVSRVVIEHPALDLGGGEDHDQAEHRQGSGGEDQYLVAAPPEDAAAQGAPRKELDVGNGQLARDPTSSSTAALKRRPRSS